MKKILIFQASGTDRKFDVKFFDTNMTPLNVGDSIDFPSKMSPTGFVKFIPQTKNIFLDTTRGEWVETTTLTGVFLAINREK